MRQLDYDGSLMCRIQGRIFEKSISMLDCSSPIFVKNYMLSEDAKSMDDLAYLNGARSEMHILDDMKDVHFGTNKYSKEEMYWLGYMYRYISYVYEINSRKLYKLIPSTNLMKYYWPGCLQSMEKVIDNISADYNLQLKNEDYLFSQTELLIAEKIKNTKYKVGK